MDGWMDGSAPGSTCCYDAPADETATSGHCWRVGNLRFHHHRTKQQVYRRQTWEQEAVVKVPSDWGPSPDPQTCPGSREFPLVWSQQLLLCRLTTTSWPPASIHWQTRRRQVITLFIYDLQNSQYASTWLNTQGRPQCLRPVVQGQFTLKLIWSHCIRSGSLCSRPSSQKEATVRNYLQWRIPQCSSKGRVSASVNNNAAVSQLRPLCLVPGISQCTVLWRLLLRSLIHETQQWQVQHLLLRLEWGCKNALSSGFGGAQWPLDHQISNRACLN